MIGWSVGPADSVDCAVQQMMKIPVNTGVVSETTPTAPGSSRRLSVDTSNIFTAVC